MATGGCSQSRFVWSSDSPERAPPGRAAYATVNPVSVPTRALLVVAALDACSVFGVDFAEPPPGPMDAGATVNGLDGGPSEDDPEGQLAVGGNHTCFVSQTGGVKCWGINTSGCLGAGAAVEANSALAVQVVGLSSGVRKVHAGSFHTCALIADRVKCWGDNGLGQLGNSQAGTFSAVPVDVEGVVSGLAGSARAVLAGGNHSCALLTDRAVQCWGAAFAGATADSVAPVTVTGL
jgi:hypothetical protein